MPKQAQFRFYEELNDFLSRDKKKTTFSYHFRGSPSIKDAIEAIGVPHTEVDLILVNGKSVSFTFQLQNDDFVSVYPVFESFDISEVAHLREKPLREPRFVLDTHLGKLARYLRMLGFDTLYENSYEDSEIIRIAEEERRIILTRDVSLLKNKTVTHGYWLRSTDPIQQLTEVVTHFDLYRLISPFHRCMVCNGVVIETTKELIEEKLQPGTRACYDEFYQCQACKKVYWKGSHYQKMELFAEKVLKDHGKE